MTDFPISRRVMLAGAAATGAAASLKQVFADDDRSIDVGLITEPTASHRTGYLSVLGKCRGVRSVSVADSTGKTLDESKQKLGERFGRGFTDAGEMMTAVKPSLTVVTLESRHAPPAIETAISAGSHVLTEKPSCVKLEDFKRAIELSNDKKRHVMLAMATRSSEAVTKARELIQTGMLGRPYAVTMDWIADQTRLKSKAYHESWLSFKARAGGGKLIYHGVHYLDVIQHLLGDSIAEINAFCQNVGGQPIEVEDAAVVNFRFSCGAIGTLNTGYYLESGKQTQIRIWGSLGWLHLDLIAGTPLQWYSTHALAPQGVQEFPYKDEGGLYQLFFQQAIDAVITGDAPPITSAESLRALATVFAGYRAAETGKTQRLA